MISPTDSSTAPSVLQLAQNAKIPVVVADIGTNSGEYVSFIISDNYDGANGVGEALAAALKAKGWEGGSVGLVTISQARKNGQARTAGFRDGAEGRRHHQGSRPAADAGLHSRRDLQVHAGHADGQSRHARPVDPDRPAGDRRAPRHQGGAADGEILLAAFDGIPDFVELLKSGEIVASGMQQPYLMGQESARAMFTHLEGGTPEKEVLVPILIVTSENIEEVLPTVKETVFANEMQ